MDSWQHQRDSQQQHADTVEEHPHTQVKEQESDQHQGWRSIQIHDGIRKRARHTREPEKVHEYQHASDDGKDQRCGPRGFQHDAFEGGPGQPPPRQQKGSGRTATGRLRRRGDTSIDAAHDDNDSTTEAVNPQAVFFIQVQGNSIVRSDNISLGDNLSSELIQWTGPMQNTVIVTE